MADQQFCLRWNNHQNTLISVFDTLLEGEILVDCTLAAEGKFLRAHKVVLSACSPFFSDLLRQHYEQHPILIMKDVKFDQLKAMLDYMYRGEVKISQDQLGTFLKAAESLQIKGLSDSAPNHEVQPKLKLNDTRTSRPPSKPDEEPMTPRSNNLSPPPRRKRRRHPSGSEDDVTEESSSELVLDPSSSPPPRVSVNSRLTNPSSPPIAPKDCSSVPPDEVTSRPPPFLTTSMFSESDPSNQQSASLVDSVLCEPKSEFIELDDDDEDMTPEDAVEAGPSHKTDGGGYSWHMERPEDSFLSQESLGGHRNAQGDGEIPVSCGMDTSWLGNPSDMHGGGVENVSYNDSNDNTSANYLTQDSSSLPWFTNESSHNCPRCGKSYQHKGSLSRHLKVECGNLRSEMCSICLKSFLYKHHLDRHMKFVHNM
ncbi:longitudinals lacking protein, isoforms A/B/D/L-like isoform X2 [Frankliniella occidentalis]|uniref:Longitudinals lacking protein, isoforms A/B/D/L-like isoform X2 n=1 Tax=Frankliniella occidentalis TaxID=133901 RepID=A0A9C6TUF7_FRAOC|nr:longitudinals lacking protein, isoforms A/B/D/L-like isoform X2 [Frankliniella occidentalis]